MSELTNEQRQTLLDQLQEERTSLRAELRTELLRSEQEAPAQVAGEVHDSGDESMADMLSDVNTQLMGQLIRQIREVEAAIQRVHGPEYGICEDCGDEIPYARLQAYPASRRCVTHQELYEKQHDSHKPSL